MLVAPSFILEVRELRLCYWPVLCIGASCSLLVFTVHLFNKNVFNIFILLARNKYVHLSCKYFWDSFCIKVAHGWFYPYTKVVCFLKKNLWINHAHIFLQFYVHTCTSRGNEIIYADFNSLNMFISYMLILILIKQFRECPLLKNHVQDD